MRKKGLVKQQSAGINMLDLSTARHLSNLFKIISGFSDGIRDIPEVIQPFGLPERLCGIVYLDHTFYKALNDNESYDSS